MKNHKLPIIISVLQLKMHKLILSVANTPRDENLCAKFLPEVNSITEL